MKKRLFLVLTLVFLILSSGFAYGASNGENIDDKGIITVGEVNIDINDENNVVKIMGGDVVIPAEQTVEGDVVSVMGDIKADGPVKGDIVGVFGDIEINNQVDGSVVSVFGTVKKGPNAQIGGDLVQVNGSNFGQYINKDDFRKSFDFSWGFDIFQLFINLGLAALLLALMPGSIQNMAGGLAREPLRKALIGFVCIIVIPLVIGVSLISIIGIPLIPLIFLAVVAAKFIGYVAVALYVGSRIREAASLNIKIFMELLIGVLILWIVGQVPVLGFISYLIVTMLALGLVIDTKFGTNKPWFPKRAEQRFSEPINYEPVPEMEPKPETVPDGDAQEKQNDGNDSLGK